MLSVSLALLLAQVAPPASDVVTRLAAPGLTSVQLDDKVAAFYTDHLVQQMGQNGVQISTPKEIAAVIGLERQRQVMGCAEDSCMAEIAAAMGVDGLVTGSVGKFGGTFQVNLKVISARSGSTIASFTGRASSEEETLDLLTQAARSLVADTLKALNRKATKVHASVGSVKKWPIVPTVAGGVMVLAGGGALFFASQNLERIRSDARAQEPTLSPSEASQLASTGSLAQTGGWVLLGAGAAALASSVLIYQLSGPAPIQTSVGVSPTSASISIGGSF
jgi:hypothetical protein